MKLARIPRENFEWGTPSRPRDCAARSGLLNPRELTNWTRTARHKVRNHQGLYLGVHEVTIDQFRQFTEEAPYEAESDRDGTGGWGYIAEIAVL